jgi:DNA-binding transcriptional LysR family regulator
MSNKLPNFSYLECFFDLAQTLSFSQTADRLRISQPAVSKQLKMLEEYLGKQLFIRDRNHVALTPAGTETFVKLGPVFKEFKSRLLSMNDHFESQLEVLKIGALSSIGQKLIVPELLAFQASKPKMRFDIKMATSDEIIAAVKVGELDIGIVGREVIQESMRSYRLLQEHIIMVGNPSLSIKNKAELKKLDYVCYRRSDPVFLSYLQKLVPKLRAKDFNIQYTVNSHQSMVEILKNRACAAVLPLHSVKGELDSGQLKKLSEYSADTSLFLIHREYDYPVPLVYEFSRFIRHKCSDS